MNDAYEDLPRRQRRRHVRTNSRRLNALDKRLDHGQCHVGLNQGEAHFTQRVLQIGVGEAGFAADSFY